MSLLEVIDNNRTDKNTLHSYIDIYENLFNKKKNDKVNILEIGIDKAGKCKTLEWLFP